MNPLNFLLAMLAITAVGALSEGFLRRRRASALRALGREWGMQYTPTDLMRLADRIAGRLPTPGAAEVRVMDLLYRTDAGRHWYVFTAEYTRGVVNAKSRVRRVIGFDEPVAHADSSEISALVVADGAGNVLDQYRQVRDGQIAAKTQARSPAAGMSAPVDGIG